MRAPLTLTSLGAAAGLALSVALIPTQAHAATVVPCNNIPALRAAITRANTAPGGGDIILIPGCTYTLTTVDPTSPQNGLPDIVGNVRIAGFNTTITRAANAAQFRIFAVAPTGTLHLTTINVSGGITSGPGGGILNAGTLSVVGGAIRNNTAGTGGGISTGPGVATLTGTTISGNKAPNGVGGGIVTAGGKTTIIASSITGNSAPDGGGIFKGAGTISLIGTSVKGNTLNNCRPLGSVPGCSN
ncbi:hypothetical protein AQJ66_21545 [Streptomyces bungoensis]|uniref:Right handed beta helix domain-containing protein n=1 Tax=Streptomyces bungoensis TaxID=285568 RepID=A0A101SYT8_9ACTN|nr:hypothetical protein [Streptomyces bungoensis]KUN82656.1 hypothetical protein AQJ66_21545 [Streptomyces bungoensis]